MCLSHVSYFFLFSSLHPSFFVGVQSAYHQLPPPPIPSFFILTPKRPVFFFSQVYHFFLSEVEFYGIKLHHIKKKYIWVIQKIFHNFPILHFIRNLMSKYDIGYLFQWPILLCIFKLINFYFLHSFLWFYAPIICTARRTNIFPIFSKHPFYVIIYIWQFHLRGEENSLTPMARVRGVN